jgi:hypothetical protein
MFGALLGDEVDNGRFSIAVGFGDFAVVGFAGQREILSLKVGQRNCISDISDANRERQFFGKVDVR